MTLLEFIIESNRIEGILRTPLAEELKAHERLLARPEIMVADLEEFVEEVAGARLRDKAGMNVRIGRRIPIHGGPKVRKHLEGLLDQANTSGSPWDVHVAYETLHPFTDGNGRSGRALWAWMIHAEGGDPFALGFLHSFYYQTLEIVGR